MNIVLLGYPPNMAAVNTLYILRLQALVRFLWDVEHTFLILQAVSAEAVSHKEQGHTPKKWRPRGHKIRMCTPLSQRNITTARSLLCPGTAKRQKFLNGHLTEGKRMVLQETTAH